MSKSVTQRAKQFGQGMTEYIIIVALIAIAAIAVYSMFGSTVRHQVSGMAQELSGQDGSSEKSTAQDSANKAGEAATAKDTGGLNSYTGNNK